tara:strand:+ start:190 stop:480 length:291 start_codon:yes stop_codon:yes gene_type:complete
MKKYEILFNYLTYFYYIITVLALIGVYTITPGYLDELKTFIKIFVSLILIYKFNPLREKVYCSKFDKKIIFNAGIYLLLTTFISDFLFDLINYGLK